MKICIGYELITCCLSSVQPPDRDRRGHIECIEIFTRRTGHLFVIRKGCDATTLKRRIGWQPTAGWC